MENISVLGYDHSRKQMIIDLLVKAKASRVYVDDSRTEALALSLGVKLLDKPQDIDTVWVFGAQITKPNFEFEHPKWVTGQCEVCGSLEHIVEYGLIDFEEVVTVKHCYACGYIFPRPSLRVFKEKHVVW